MLQWQTIRLQNDNIKTQKILKMCLCLCLAALMKNILKGVCQLQVSFAQPRPKGHYKSESDSSNGAWGYI